MSQYYARYTFFFCNEVEAETIKNFVDELKEDAKQNGGDISYSCADYNHEVGGIEVSSNKRNDPSDDFLPLKWRFPFLWMSLDDDSPYYTNDTEHIVFPMYIIEGEGVKDVQELKEVMANDYQIDLDQEDVDPNNQGEFLEWMEENEIYGFAVHSC